MKTRSAQVDGHKSWVQTIYFSITDFHSGPYYTVRIFHKKLNTLFRAEDELDYNIPKDEDSDDPKAFNEVARCHTGYSYPRAKVAWLNKDGESVSDCNNEMYFDTSGCNADKDDSEVLWVNLVGDNILVNSVVTKSQNFQ